MNNKELERIMIDPKYSNLADEINYFLKKEKKDLNFLTKNNFRDYIIEVYINNFLRKKEVSFISESDQRRKNDTGKGTPDFVLSDNNIIIECKNISDNGIISAFPDSFALQMKSSNVTDKYLEDYKAEYDRLAQEIARKLNSYHFVGYHILLKNIKFLVKDNEGMKKVRNDICSKRNNFYSTLIRYIHKKIDETKFHNDWTKIKYKRSVLEIDLEIQKSNWTKIKYKCGVLEIDLEVQQSNSGESTKICEPDRFGFSGKMDCRLIKEVKKKYEKYKRFGREEKVIVAINVDYGYSISDLENKIFVLFQDKKNLIAVILFEGNYEWLNQRGLFAKIIYINKNINLENKQIYILELFKTLCQNT